MTRASSPHLHPFRRADADELQGGDALGYITLAQSMGKVPMTNSSLQPATVLAARLPPFDFDHEWLHTDDYQPPPMARQSLQQWHQRPVLPAVAALTVNAPPAARPHALAASVRQAPWRQQQQSERHAQPTTVGRRKTAEVPTAVAQSPDPEWRGPAQLFQEPSKSPGVERTAQEVGPASGIQVPLYPVPAQYREAHRNSGSPIQNVPVAWNPLFQSAPQQAQHVQQDLPASVAAALPAMQDLGLAGAPAGLVRTGHCSTIRVEIDDEYESYSESCLLSEVGQLHCYLDGGDGAFDPQQQLCMYHHLLDSEQKHIY